MSAKHILFISSDSFDVKFLTKRAEETGIKCLATQDNKSVEDSLKQRSISVIVFNYSTKNFSVKRFVEFLTSNPSLDDVPIIVLITNEDFSKAQNFLYEVSDDFLIKPFDPKVMIIKIKTALRNKALSDEIKNNLRSIQDRNNKELYEEKLGILKEVTSNIANELKNPVNFIKNFTEIALDNANSLVIADTYNTEVDEKNHIAFEKLIENLNAVYKYSSQLDSSMRFMLNQSNMKKGDSIKTKITALIDNSFQLSLQKFKKELGQRQIVYETDYDLWNQKITIDPVNIQRAFGLIFDNAIESILEIEDEKIVHLIRISTKFDNKSKMLNVIISDNGIGIPPNVIPNIFKPFFTTKPGHHGLGLATVQEIVEKGHLGKISISSILGKSTDVTIFLPAFEIKKEDENVTKDVWIDKDENTAVINDATSADDTEGSGIEEDTDETEEEDNNNAEDSDTKEDTDNTDADTSTDDTNRNTDDTEAAETSDNSKE